MFYNTILTFGIILLFKNEEEQTDESEKKKQKRKRIVIREPKEKMTMFDYIYYNPKA